MRRRGHHACLYVALLTSLIGCAKSTADEPIPAQAGEIAPRAPQTLPLVAALAVPADAETSPSGLVWKVLEPGRGEARPGLRDKVRIDFTAYNGKGEISDGSAKRGGPTVFELEGVIAGWSEALQQMRVGEQRRIWSPDHLTYPGRPGPPRPPAVFDLTLLEIIPGHVPPPAPADVARAPADAIKLASGLAYKRLTRAASAAKPNAWDRVTLHYAGWRADGAPIESTAPERPARFDIPDVMPGWRALLPLLAVGERVRAWIPETLAYQGRTGEPTGNVVFELELVAIERRPQPPRAPAHLTQPPQAALKTASGLAYLIEKRGQGKIRPRPTDRVELHYSTWSADGTLVDSSVTRGKSARAPLSQLIPGWAEGLTYMVEGDRALLWIPERLAYAGRAGSPAGDLVVQVELLKIEP